MFENPALYNKVFKLLNQNQSYVGACADRLQSQTHCQVEGVWKGFIFVIFGM